MSTTKKFKNVAGNSGCPASNFMKLKEGRILEETEWISAVLSGEHQAFGHLVNRYQGMVYRVCIKITGEAESAKDMAQEVFIKAYKALPSFRGSLHSPPGCTGLLTGPVSTGNGQMTGSGGTAVWRITRRMTG